MANYHQLKNAAILTPTTNTDLGSDANRYSNVYMSGNIVMSNGVTVTSTNVITPKIASVSYPGDDTAADIAGGQTITITGTGFSSGANVLVGGTPIAIVTVLSSTSITFISPALAVGNYALYVINSDGGTAIYIPGISYSGTPTWSTGSGSLATVYETNSISNTVAATGDSPVSYSVYAGSLPTGSSLNTSSGLISGTAPASAGSTTYTFTIRATDAQKQDTDRSFSITVNTDAVTWNSPADNTTSSIAKDQSIASVTLSATSAAGKSITYSANALPTGLSISSNTIIGTPTVVGSTSSLITATAATTGRTATRTFNWVVSIANDMYFKNTALLLNGETTVTPFISDASTNNLGLTIVGDTKPVTFNPYTPGYYSNYFDGNGDYLSAADNDILEFTSVSFSIEAYIYVTTLKGYQAIMSKPGAADGNGWVLYFETNNTLNFIGGNGSWTATFGAGTPIVSTNTWYHIVVTRDSATNIWRMFIDGVLKATQTITLNLANLSYPFYIGWYPNFPGAASTQSFSGYISNVRVYKNAIPTEYITSSTTTGTLIFTRPTSPITSDANTSLLTCQSNRFIDNSSNNFTITKAGDTIISPAIPFAKNASYSTYGSAYFDGTGDYLNAGSNAVLNLSGDFTVEMWVYGNTADWNSGDAGGYTCLVDTRNQSNSTENNRIFFGIQNSISAPYFYNAGTNTQTSSSITVSVGVWNHIAYSRSGSTIKIFVNGIQGASFTDSTTFSASRWVIGTGSSQAGGSNNRAAIQGYISDHRVVKGTAVYTTAFNPPTLPLTAITNTSLLTLQYNGGANNSGFIDNGPFNNIITRNGNTSQGTFSPYSQTGWSTYFPTTNDWLTLTMTANETSYGFRGSFTVECWIYADAKPASLGWIYLSGRGGANYLVLYMNSSGYIVYGGSSSGARITANTAYVPGTWTHIAVSRTAVFGSSGLVKMFIDGVEQTTTYNDGGGDNWTIGSPSYIGNDGNTNYTWPVYISNLRVITGRGMYTAAFTPATSPLTTVSVSPVTDVNAETQMVICQSNRFIDNGPNRLAITVNGAPSIQAYSPFGSVTSTPASYSLYQDVDSSINFGRVTNNPTTSLGTGAFTVEGWFYPTASMASKNTRIISLGRDSAGTNTSWDLYINNGTSVVWNKIDTTATTYSGNYTFSLNTWYHIVVCRNSSSNLAIFVNGTRVFNQASVTTSYDYVTGTIGGHYIGASYNGTTWSYGRGYYSNIRIIKSATAYDPTQTTITVPTTQLSVTANTSLLLFANRFIEDSVGTYTSSLNDSNAQNLAMTTFNPFGYTTQSVTSYTPSIHGGSAYFDGTGDYLSTPDSTLFTIGSNDFTFECWVYPTSITNGNNNILVQWGTGNAWIFRYVNSTGRPQFSGGGTSITGTTTSVLANQWNHIAITRYSNMVRLFVNGVLDDTKGSVTTLTDGASQVTIGAYSDGTSEYVTGYISDLRLINGNYLYTATFVPPTQPIGNYSNYSTTYPSSLLLNFNNGGIIDQHSSSVFETVGNVQLSTAVKKYNNGSIYFDGTGDYLQRISPPPSLVKWNLGSYTIEYWIYANAFTQGGNTGGDPVIVGNMSATGTGNYWSFGPISNGTVKFYYYSGSIQAFATTSTLSTGQWYHLAFVNNAGALAIYINGVSSATSTISGTPVNGSDIAFTIGSANGASFNGYIDDLRITNGVARYTANFTPPTSALLTK